MLKWFKRKLDGDPPTASDSPAGEAGGEVVTGGLFSRLRQGLGKTHASLANGIRNAIGLKQAVDEDLLESIEEILLRGDVGYEGTEKVVERLRREGKRRETYDPEALTSLVKETLTEILEVDGRAMNLSATPPTVILVVGVNGTGKTTTIGKLALQFTRQGKRTMLVAADTFRAAAVDQLRIWAERSESCLVEQPEGTDPASVCHEALSSAKTDPPDVVLIDTAGRLHTKTKLMDELRKVVRVIKKVLPGAPHETLLVLDATTGQNALNQVRVFDEVVDLTGLIMTKLDGTAKGGILVAVKQAHPSLPVFKIGIGEQPEDLRDFDAREFAEALFATDE